MRMRYYEREQNGKKNKKVNVRKKKKPNYVKHKLRQQSSLKSFI